MRQFIGEVGEGVVFARHLYLQGGGQDFIKIGKGTKFGSHCILGCWRNYPGLKNYTPQIVIGNYCNIGEYNHISAINGIFIGDGLLTGRFVYIGDNSHGGLSWDEASIPPANRPLESKGEIRIGNNVWIGDKVTILSDVIIGDNVIIGANSVVTHSIPSNSIAGGIPARVLRTLNDS